MPRYSLSHPWTNTIFTPQGSNHQHAFMGDGESIEDYAEGLAEAVGNCDAQAHGGDWLPHSKEDQEQAYKAAIEQLLSRDYWQEYVDLQRAIEHYELWNGDNPNPQPVPKMVFQPNPDNPRQWQLFITHPETGLPFLYNISEKVLDLPPPDPKEYHQGSLGWYRKGATANERLARRMGELNGRT